MIDSTIVRAHQHSAGAQKKDGLMIKRLEEVKVVSQPRVMPHVMRREIQQRSVKTMIERGG